MSVDFTPEDDWDIETAPVSAVGRLDLPALPAPLTPLIGRDAAIDRIAGLLADPDARLITLIGPGGIGKTRLALAAAGRSPDPVAFVSLATIVDPALIVPTIAQALGLEPVRDLPADLALRRSLRDRRLLLVLDNFEQVLAGAATVSELLRNTPGLRVLVTSRVRLSLSGEHVMPVEPLALPESASTEDIAESSAVRLFIQRARAAHPSFVMSESGAPAIAAICRKLDGLPLAIELAAARSNLLSPEALASRLDRRLHLLTGGPQDAPARHQTMWAAIAWSYDLLGEDERRCWERLGVFTGGFTVEAAEALGQPPPDATLDGLAMLQSLVDQGLLSPATNRLGEPRFQMLETTREFAQQRLAASGDDDARTAHATWFQQYAKVVEPGLMGSESDAWFIRAEAEIANFRSALGWLRDRREIAAALGLAADLAWFWTAPNYIAEGRGWYAELLALAGPEIDPSLRAKTLQAAGDLAHWHGDSDVATAMFEEALPLWREVNDEGRIAATLRSLGSVAIDRGASDEAVQLLGEAFALSRNSGHAWDAAAAANLMGVAQKELGAYPEAARWHEEALVEWQRIGSVDHVPIALAGLGWTQLGMSDLQAARDSFDAAFSVAGDREPTYDTAWSLVGIAAIAAGLHQDAVAARLLGAAAAQRSLLALPLRPPIQRMVDSLTDQVRTQLGNAAFAVEWRHGQGLSNPDAIREARALQVPTSTREGLSRRELEVLVLLVEGTSDNEIAERLFITRRTVSKHVAAILEKLGADNRTAAATAALRRGLV